MRKTKMRKYRTVLGALRSYGDPNEDGERKAINSLIPQMGIDDSILPEESPLEGCKRLLQVHSEPKAVMALKACIKWINRPKFVSSSSTGARVGMIFRGKTYSHEETFSIEATCRALGVTTQEAIDILAKGENDAA